MAWGHRARGRPITGITPAGVGATYVIVEGYQDDINVQIVEDGTTTNWLVQWTNQNILYDDTALQAVNLQQRGEGDRYVAPASAQWADFTPVLNQDTPGNASSISDPIFALRIQVLAGVSTDALRYHITVG